jgi:predicted MFS family arabinose efflux permease
MFRLSIISRRLLPLYGAVFCQGVVFWYAIEKLFMTNIGFNEAGIGAMVAAYSAVMLAIEAPAGILADRWSRKGVLILASVALGLSALLGGISTSPALFVISTMFWGVYTAFSSGTYDSIIYDVLQEEEGSSKHYEQFYGRHKIVEGFAFVVGALGGGVMAQLLGMRANFFYSLIPILLSIVLLWRFRDPTIHKAEPAASLKDHIGETLHAVLRQRTLLTILVSLVSLTVVLTSLYEFSQLWLIALALPIIFYGPASALLFASWSIGGMIAGLLRSRRTLLFCCAAMLLSALYLSISHVAFLIVIAQTVLAIGIVGVTVILTHQLHDQLPSRIRAGASSTVSSISSIVIIPTALTFGVLAHAQSIFAANILLVGILAVGLVAVVRHKQISPSHS